MPGVVRLILRGTEMSLGERVVVRDAWATHALVDAEVGEEVLEGVACHRRTTVVVDREFGGHQVVARNRLLEELLGQSRVLVGRYHPADDVATEEVEHDVEVQEDALLVGWIFEISQVQTRFGASASRRGIAKERASRWSRRSRKGPSSPSTRYIVRHEQ